MMQTNAVNRLESRLGGITLRGSPHQLSAWTILGLRLVTGLVFLQAGYGKLTDGFGAQGYLANVDPASPASGLYGAMAADATLMATVDVIVPATQVLIGVGLLVGGLVRLAALGGAAQMALFYLGSWDVAGGYVNSQLVYAVVLLALGALAAGRILGADAALEETTLVERYPRLRYLLG